MDHPIAVNASIYFPIPRQRMYRVQKYHHFRRMKWLGVISDETLHVMNGGGHHGLFMVLAYVKKVWVSCRINICVMGLYILMDPPGPPQP